MQFLVPISILIITVIFTAWGFCISVYGPVDDKFRKISVRSASSLALVLLVLESYQVFQDYNEKAVQAQKLQHIFDQTDDVKNSFTKLNSDIQTADKDIVKKYGAVKGELEKLPSSITTLNGSLNTLAQEERSARAEIRKKEDAAIQNVKERQDEAAAQEGYLTDYARCDHRRLDSIAEQQKSPVPSFLQQSTEVPCYDYPLTMYPSASFPAGSIVTLGPSR